MKNQDYRAQLLVRATPAEAFRAINSISEWWTEHVEGSSERLDDEFVVRFGEVHISKQRLVEVIPQQKVVWLVTESRLNFVANPEEWTNTKVSFEISPRGEQTLIEVTHHGLQQQVECYDACRGAWDQYLKGSLLRLLNEGRGAPERK